MISLIILCHNLKHAHCLFNKTCVLFGEKYDNVKCNKKHFTICLPNIFYIRFMSLKDDRIPEKTAGIRNAKYIYDTEFEKTLFELLK